MDPLIKQYIDREIERKTSMMNRSNAGGAVYDQVSGLHTQGKNLIGLTGNRAIHNVIRTNLTEQTIASGVINFSSSDIVVATEGTASSDDLDTINPNTLAQGGDLLILRAADDGDTVVVKNGTGNLQLHGSFSLDSIDDRLLLQWDAVNEYWVEIARTDSSSLARVHVYDSSMPAIASGSTTTVTFDTEAYDVGGMWEGVTNPTRITAPVDGRYMFHMHTIWPSNATGFRYQKLLLNGTTTVFESSRNAVNGDKTYMHGDSTVLNLTGGDYIEWQLYQNSGGNLTPESGSRKTYLTVDLLID